MTAEDVMATPELKPCPFCGGKGITVSYGDRHNDDMVLVSTRCLSCKATTTQISSHRDDVCGAYEDSKTKWNARAPQPQSGDRAKALAALYTLAQVGQGVQTSNQMRNELVGVIRAALTQPGFEEVDVDSIDPIIDRSAARHLMAAGYQIVRKKGAA